MTPRAATRVGPLIGLVLIALAGVIAVPTATADIGLVRVGPKVVRPGERVNVEVGCGWCRAPTGFSVSLVPLAKAPVPHPCPLKVKGRIETALCSPIATAPPRHGPFVYLGGTRPSGVLLPNADPPGSKSDLGFAAPDLAPGPYAFVIFSGLRDRGGRGSLIVNTTPGKVLWILPRDAPLYAAEGAANPTSWTAAHAEAIALLLAIGLLLGR